MIKALKDVCIGREAVNALVSKGKIVGMMIGFAAGVATGMCAIKCYGKMCKCKTNEKNYNCNCNSMVDEVVDAASKIKSTLCCDCDDEGTARIPQEQKRAAER